MKNENEEMEEKRPHWSDDLGICDELIESVSDPRTMLWYKRHHRHFFIPVISADVHEFPFWEPVEGSGVFIPRGALQGISFCPWRGTALPRKLRDVFLNKLGQVMKTDDAFMIGFQDEIPPPFRNDRWWREMKIPVGKTTEDKNFEQCEPAETDMVELWHWHRRPLDPVDHPPLAPSLCGAPGYRRALVRSPHACDQMIRQLEDVRVMITYLPHTREYGIQLLEPFDPMYTQALRIRPIRHCPWCGEKLPESLKVEWESRLARQNLVVDDPGWPTNLPPAYCTDTWWRDAGL